MDGPLAGGKQLPQPSYTAHEANSASSAHTTMAPALLPKPVTHPVVDDLRRALGRAPVPTSPHGSTASASAASMGGPPLLQRRRDGLPDPEQLCVARSISHSSVGDVYVAEQAASRPRSPAMLLTQNMEWGAPLRKEVLSILHPCQCLKKFPPLHGEG